MLDVYITIDTEVWCGGWKHLDQRFPGAFRAYVHGPTSRGNYALPETLKILTDHGLVGVFFTEPLFSARFGLAPLEEIVGMLSSAGQEIQLHIHTEWLDEATTTVIDDIERKVRVLTELDESQQFAVIEWGLNRLELAGARRPNAFRAGSYAANIATLRALQRAGISFDSSYNAGAEVGVADIAPGECLTQPSMIEGVCVYPVSVVAAKGGRYRNLQINALSFREIVKVLEFASDHDWDSVVLVSHNFEMLTPDKCSVDAIAHNRFVKVCGYLGKHRDRFRVQGFRSAIQKSCRQHPAPGAHPALSLMRHAEQAYRRFRYR